MSNLSRTQSNPSTDDTSQLILPYQVAVWTLVAVVCMLSIIVWGHDYSWRLFPSDLYHIFPLLGLLAYSIMWTHYIAGAFRQLLKLPKGIVSTYFKSTSWVVLGLICLHPGLLVYQRFRDGFGLPPHSYESYVNPGLGWVTLLGTVSLLIFLAWELHRFFSKRPWWKYVQLASDVAMLAIFYHGLRLGQQISHGWFHTVWWFYGITLIATLLYTYGKRNIFAAPKNA